MPTTPTDQPRTVRISKTYHATRQEIFDAWTDPESFKQWMSPVGVTVTYLASDVRVGGAYRIDMQAGNETIVHTGVYQVIEAPAKLVFTWKSQNTMEQATLVTVELFERGAQQTELVLTHEQLPNRASAQAHEEGWHSVLNKLDSHLNSQSR